jgi:hypothetical protein
LRCANAAAGTAVAAAAARDDWRNVRRLMSAIVALWAGGYQTKAKSTGSAFCLREQEIRSSGGTLQERNLISRVDREQAERLAA